MKIEKGIEEILNRLTDLEIKIDAIGNIIYDKLIIKKREKNKIKWKGEKAKQIKKDKERGVFREKLNE